MQIRQLLAVVFTDHDQIGLAGRTGAEVGLVSHFNLLQMLEQGLTTGTASWGGRRRRRELLRFADYE